MEAILLWLFWIFFVLAGVFIIWRESKSDKYENDVIMVMFKNCEHICEGIMRHLFSLEAGIKGGTNFLIIDDCSTDKTAQILKSLSRQRDNVEVIYRDDYSKESYYQIKHMMSHLLLVLDLREYDTCV